MDRELAAIIVDSIDYYLKTKDINIHNGILNSLENKLVHGRYTDVFKYIAMKVEGDDKQLSDKEKHVKYIEMDRPSYLCCTRSFDSRFIEGKKYPIKYCVEKNIDDNYYITEYAVVTETGKEVTVPTFSPGYGFKIVIL